MSALVAPGASGVSTSIPDRRVVAVAVGVAAVAASPETVALLFGDWGLSPSQPTMAAPAERSAIAVRPAASSLPSPPRSDSGDTLSCSMSAERSG